MYLCFTSCSIVSGLILLYCILSSPEPSGSQGERIVYPCYGVRHSRQQFQTSSPLKPIGHKSQIVCVAYLGRGNQSLYEFLRYITNSRKSTPAYILHAELGCKPIDIKVKTRMIVFWLNIVNGKDAKIT